MTDRLPPYSGGTATCTKCNSGDVSATYREGVPLLRRDHDGDSVVLVTNDTDARPCLVRACQDCGWAWVEACADTEQRDRVPALDELPRMLSDTNWLAGDCTRVIVKRNDGTTSYDSDDLGGDGSYTVIVNRAAHAEPDPPPNPVNPHPGQPAWARDFLNIFDRLTNTLPVGSECRQMRREWQDDGSARITGTWVVPAPTTMMRGHDAIGP